MVIKNTTHALWRCGKIDKANRNDPSTKLNRFSVYAQKIDEIPKWKVKNAQTQKKHINNSHTF